MKITKEQFKNECNVFRTVKEYPGYTGEEKRIIITDLEEDEFYTRYESILSDFVPFLQIKTHGWIVG